MRRIRFMQMLLFVHLLAGLNVFVSQANANEIAAVFIDPSSIKGWDYAPYTEFAIAVFVANVSDLSVVTFNISYKPFIFSYRSLSLGALSHGPKPRWQVDDEQGGFWLNVTYDTEITAATPIMLVNITFLILARGETTLDIHDTQLIDLDGHMIFHLASDSYFNNLPSYDVNKDGKIDILDVALVASAFGSYPGHPRWDPDADLNGDCKIDIRDIAIVACHFGEYCT